MDKKVSLILCSQFHLPSGAAEEDFEAIYNTKIKPLVSALDKHPKINMTFHYSGVILYWIERRYPELFMLLEDLLSRKQIEFLGGGFYNPIFPILPLADKIGQIEMLTTYLRKHFGKKPQGCWLPAMAWEQNLVGPLTSCGMSYTFLSDLQFSAAGIKPGVDGYFFPCITEDQGKLITVFPVAGTMGGELWNGEPLKAINDFAGSVQAAHTVMVLPVEGMLSHEKARPMADYDKLFEEISKADDQITGAQIEFTTPSRVIKNLSALKRIYFSGVWTSENKGNSPRRFLSDHPDAGGIYAKMIYVHTLINNQLRGDKARKRTALEELWKAQDSGVSHSGYDIQPGLLCAPVRKAAYRSLLEAEKITREKGKFTPSLSVFDFDLDGEGEYIFQDDKLNCFIKQKGAGIFELDYMPCTWNYMDTLSRAGDERRRSFADWLVPEDTPLEKLGSEDINGGRFCGAEKYEVAEADRVRRKVIFSLNPNPSFHFGDMAIEKTWQLKKNFLSVEYVLKNSGSNELKFIFSPSIDLSFPGEGETFLRVLALRDEEKENIAAGGGAQVKNVKALEFQDLKNEAVITLEANRNFDGRLFHLFSPCAGRDEYQSTCFMPAFAVSLESGKSWKVSLSLKISS